MAVAVNPGLFASWRRVKRASWREMLEERDRAHLAAGLFRGLHPAELEDGVAPRELGSHAGAEVVCGREEPREDGGRLLPVARFLVELLPAHPCELVELGLAIVLRDAPFGGDRPLLLEPQERRVQSSVVQGEEVAARLLDAARDPVPVKWPQGLEGLEHHQGQGALPDVRLVAHGSPMA